MVKYSVIVPVYNCEKYLGECIDSILAQTYKDFEILLVDDGSTDGSGRLCDEYAAQYPYIRSFHKENGGAASARNYGIEKAEGEHLLFIDGDDTVDAALLDTVNECLTKDKEALIIYGMAFDYYKAEKLQRTEKLSCSHEGILSTQELLAHFAQYFWDNALSSACNKVFSAKTIRKHGLRFPEGMTLYEDFDFVLQYLGHAQNICCCAQPFYHYRHDLGKPHLNARVRDLTAVRRNMSRLLTTASQLASGCEGNSQELQNTMANLYMQLLSQNLMACSYSLKEMKAGLTNYCSEDAFRGLLASGAELSGAEKKLLERMDAGRFQDIKREFQKRKLISKGKRMAKKLLGKQ